MPLLRALTSTLAVIDVQARLVPAIHAGADIVARTGKLMEAARLLAVPVVITEQNPRGLGPTVAELPRAGATVIEKMTFDSTGGAGFLEALAAHHAVVIAGCEAHVCVLQTVLALRERGRRVFVVQDAIGSRHPDNKAAALARMQTNGAEIVTTEMVVFEWLETANHPRFRDVVALIK